MSQKLLDVVLQGVRQTILNSAVKNMNSLEAKECGQWLQRLFDYNMAGGKHQRSRLALNTYQSLQPKATATEIMNAAKVSASIELLQTFFLILDDVMDHSKMRRKKPCWYTVEDVGLSAINDGCVLEAGIHEVLIEAIPQHPQVIAILQTIQRAKFKTSVGQFLDNASTKPEHSDWSRYAQIVEHKTSHYSFYTPIAVGFLLADHLHHSKEYTDLAYKFGYLFQAQDDYLDVYGDPETTGKVGADIGNGKCTWLSCKTLDLIRTDVRKIQEFAANFGQADEQKSAVVKRIMDDVNVGGEFTKFQKKTVDDLHSEIDAFSVKEVKHVFHNLVENLSGRRA